MLPATAKAPAGKRAAFAPVAQAQAPDEHEDDDAGDFEAATVTLPLLEYLDATLMISTSSSL